MTLRQLILSADPNDFQDNALFLLLKDTQPEYGTSVHIKVGKNGDTISVTNVHVGSLGDIVAKPIDVAEGLHLKDEELLKAILDEMSNDGFTDADADAFWDDIHDFEARFAERFRDFDLSDTVGMYSLFDLDPYDAAIGVDEKQQNFNALVKKLNALDQTALSERLSARHDAVRARLYAIYRELPRVFVQDDANESNVLVDENGRFAGLIDFNLAGTEVVVNTFANWSAGDYRITEKEPIGAAVRLESALREYRRCMDRAFSFYRATAREREAAGLYAWIAMAVQWPVFCFFDAALDAGGARRDETLELLGLIADLDPDSLRA